MDTKVIAMVGAVIVVGAAVYGVATGTVLPSVEEITEGEPSDTDGITEDGSDTEDEGGSENENGSEGSGAGGDGTRGGDEDQDQAVANETDEVTEPEPGLPVICEQQGGNIGRGDVNNVPSAAGPVFDPLLFESMLHERLNGLRGIRSDAKPLRCDPELREIARKHSELYLLKNGEGDQFARSSRNEMRKRVRSLGGKLESRRGVVRQSNIKIKPAESRYEGVCENPRETVGRWFYQRETGKVTSGDFRADSSRRPRDQRVAFIADHDDLVRDVRGSWVSRGGRRRGETRRGSRGGSFLGKLTDEEATRQGVGAYIDRQTREVVVTHVVC